MPLSETPDPRADAPACPATPPQSLLTKCYLTYVILGGDVAKTAVACDVSEQFVVDYAVKEDWHERLEAVANLCSPTSRGPAEIERLLNRTALYVQAQRIRRIIDGLLSEIESSDKASLMELFTVHTKEGSRVDLKPINDLTQASLKLSQMSQAAMCDTPSERVRRMQMDARAGDDSLQLGAEVLKGLSNIPANSPDSETVALEMATKARGQLEAK